MTQIDSPITVSFPVNTSAPMQAPKILVRLSMAVDSDKAGTQQEAQEFIQRLTEAVRRTVDLELGKAWHDRAYKAAEYSYVFLTTQYPNSKPPQTQEEWEAAYQKWREELIACQR